MAKQKYSSDQVKLAMESLSPAIRRQAQKAPWKWDRNELFIRLALLSLSAQMLGADDKDVEVIHRRFLAKPGRHRFYKVLKDFRIKDQGLPPNAANFNLDELLEIEGELFALGDDDSTSARHKSHVWDTIAKHRGNSPNSKGLTAGIKEAAKTEILAKKFGIPPQAAAKLSYDRIMDGLAAAQQYNMDGFIGEQEFWDDVEKMGQGRTSGEKFYKKWNDKYIEEMEKQQAERRRAMVEQARRVRTLLAERERAAREKEKQKPVKKKPKRRGRVIIGEPVIIPKTLGTAVMSYHEDGKPKIKMTSYSNGTVKFTHLDEAGNVVRIHREYWGNGRVVILETRDFRARAPGPLGKGNQSKKPGPMGK